MRYSILATISVTLLCSCTVSSPDVLSVSNEPRDAAVLSDSDLAMERQLDNYFSVLANDRDFSGIIRIERGGKTVIQKEYGFSDWTRKVPHTSNTKFSAGSVTKGITAGLILRLRDKGALSLEDSVAKHIPSLHKLSDVTIADVLAHEGGLPRDLEPGLNLDSFDGKVANWLSATPNLIQPDRTRSYSNVGFILLAEIAEAAAKDTYANLVRTHIFIPNGMNDSLINLNGSGEYAEGAKPHVPGPAPSGVMLVESTLLAAGGAGLVTTISDLARWGRVIGKGGFAELRNEEQSLGSVVYNEEDGQSSYWVQGSLPGFAAGVTVWPEQDLTISYVSNLFSYAAINTERVLWSVVQGSPLPALSTREPEVALNTQHLEYIGAHNHPSFGPIEIAKHESEKGLEITMPERGSDWTFYLTPVSNNRLHWRAFNAVLERNEAGVIQVRQQLQMSDPFTYEITQQ